MQIKLPIAITRSPKVNYYLESSNKIRTILVILLF
jgi:hypothetical protein